MQISGLLYRNTEISKRVPIVRQVDREQRPVVFIIRSMSGKPRRENEKPFRLSIPGV